MRRAFLRGAWLSVRSGLLVGLLWLVNGLFGLVFALASGYWLTEALDGSLASRTLLRDLDPNVFVDLYYYHQDGLRMLLVLACVMGVAYVLLWGWFHGAIIFAVRQSSAPTPREALTKGLVTGPAIMRLFVIAMILLAAFSALIGGGSWALIRWTITSPSAMIWYYIVGCATTLWCIGCVLLVAVHDHARIRVCATGRGAMASYGWAWRFVLRGGERAFSLAVLLQATAFTLWVTYHTIGMNFPVTGGIGVGGSLVWGAAFMLARMWMRVWFFAAQSELQT